MRITYDALSKNYSSCDASAANYASASDILEEIGWSAQGQNSGVENLSAIRLSLALVKSGIPLAPASAKILSGDEAQKSIEGNYQRLVTLLSRNSYLGAPEEIEAKDIHSTIGVRRGILAFHTAVGANGGGHIELVRGGAEAARSAAKSRGDKNIYLFWPLIA